MDPENDLLSEKERRKMKRVILCGVIILTCWAFWGCDTTSTTTVSTTSLILLDRGTVAQDETIYIEAGTDGNAETMILVSRIPQATRGTYDQYGSFTAAQNLSGREPLLVENGQLRIPVASEGTDFYYRATLAEGYEPPFLLAFTYRKNGMVIDPADEKGNAGLFSIEIRVRPNPAATAEFRNRFLCQLQVTVPAAGTTITEAAGGTVVLTGGSFTTGFMTLPGSSATYSLSWETTDFSIRSIQATFTPFSPEVLGSDLSGFGTSPSFDFGDDFDSGRANGIENRNRNLVYGFIFLILGIDGDFRGIDLAGGRIGNAGGFRGTDGRADDDDRHRCGSVENRRSVLVGRIWRIDEFGE
jgi:hypothetical protein